MAHSPDPRQISLMDAIDAAGPHPDVPRVPDWWRDAWRAGDAIPPGWRPAVPGDSDPKPRREAGTLPGALCDDADEAVTDAVDAWAPPDSDRPFVGIHETRRLPDGSVWACLEARDGGLSHVAVRDGTLSLGHVPGAGALVPLEGTTQWTRLPAEEAWDDEAQDWRPVAPAVASDVAVEEADVAQVIAPIPIPTESVRTGGPAAFLHALTLATDTGWEALVKSLHRTTPDDVREAVTRHRFTGVLSAVNAAALLERAGVAEPDDGTRLAPPPPADFFENLDRARAEAKIARDAEFCPGRALVEAGLAVWGRRGVDLLAPASTQVTLVWRPTLDPPLKHHLLLLDDRYADSPAVRQIEEVARLKSQPVPVRPRGGRPVAPEPGVSPPPSGRAAGG